MMICKKENRYATSLVLQNLRNGRRRLFVATAIVTQVNAELEIHWSDPNDGEVHYESATAKKWGDYTAGEIHEISQFLRNAVDFVLGQNEKHFDKDFEELIKDLLRVVHPGAPP